MQITYETDMDRKWGQVVVFYLTRGSAPLRTAKDLPVTCLHPQTQAGEGCTLTPRCILTQPTRWATTRASPTLQLPHHLTDALWRSTEKIPQTVSTYRTTGITRKWRLDQSLVKCLTSISSTRARTRTLTAPLLATSASRSQRATPDLCQIYQSFSSHHLWRPL